MTTEDIAKGLKLTAQLMELHSGNPFKVKSILNAAYTLDKTGVDLNGRSMEELSSMEGIGKGIAAKIIEFQEKGTTAELTELLEKTPVGVIEMMGVKGIGPKKVAMLWKELEIESVGELLYACNENRLITLKGFGEKTQEQIRKQIEFHLSNSGKVHYATIEGIANEIVAEIKKRWNTELVSLTGAIRRKLEVIDVLELVVAMSETSLPKDLSDRLPIPYKIHWCNESTFVTTLFATTGTTEHLEQFGPIGDGAFQDEQQIYSSKGYAYLEPELREGFKELERAKKGDLPKLIELSDLKGILHNHSTYSDGLNSLEEMASYCKQLGYEYLGICDHSQSAFYANGLKPERVKEQHAEIDRLNEKLAPFKIFKGIESDILNDGSLDYSEEVLKSFDFVVASVHSNLKMDREKATQRLITAIENPFTTILGHPTGRLLLSREGYPIDHKKVIDACASNGVIMELNSHPYRLDIDWRWVQYCLDNGVRISINPDAHEKEGYHDMYYGVCVARKGFLDAANCFNAMDRQQMSAYFESRKIK